MLGCCRQIKAPSCRLTLRPGISGGLDWPKSAPRNYPAFNTRHDCGDAKARQGSRSNRASLSLGREALQQDCRESLRGRLYAAPKALKKGDCRGSPFKKALGSFRCEIIRAQGAPAALLPHAFGSGDRGRGSCEARSEIKRPRNPKSEKSQKMASGGTAKDKN